MCYHAISYYCHFARPIARSEGHSRSRYWWSAARRARMSSINKGLQKVSIIEKRKKCKPKSEKKGEKGGKEREKKVEKKVEKKEGKKRGKSGEKTFAPPCKFLKMTYPRG